MVDFHDSTLISIQIDWGDGTARLQFTLVGGAAVSLIARGVMNFHLPRRHPWGASRSVNTLTISGNDASIEMQSGDTIVVVAAAFETRPG